MMSCEHRHLREVFELFSPYSWCSAPNHGLSKKTWATMGGLTLPFLPSRLLSL